MIWTILCELEICDVIILLSSRRLPVKTVSTDLITHFGLGYISVIAAENAFVTKVPNDSTKLLWL